MGDSVRELRAALQTAAGVVPTTFTKVHPRVGSFTWALGRAREQDDVETGGLVKTIGVLAGASEDTISFDTSVYYSINPILIAPIINDFVPVAVGGGVSGAYTHTAKEGSNRPLICFQWYDGTDWWQALDFAGNSFTLNQANKAPGVLSYEYMGGEVTNISAPSAVSGTAPTSASWSHLQVSVGGVATDIMSGSITIANNREGLHVARRNNNPKRMLEGNVDVTFDILPDYTTYAGSMFKRYIENTLPSDASILFEYVGPNTVGTGGTPPNELFHVKLQKAVLTGGTHDQGSANTRHPITGRGAFSYTAGAATEVKFITPVATYVAA